MKRTSQQHEPAKYLHLVVLAALVLGILITGIIVSNEVAVRTQHEKTDKSWSLVVRAVSADDRTIGPVSAPVQLVVYADLSCEYCKAFFERTFPKLRSLYGDSVVFAFRHKPLPRHPASRREAIAAECVYSQGGNGAFWKFITSVYQESDYQSGVSDARLKSLAVAQGISSGAYDRCVIDEVPAARVDQDALESAVAGVQVTPSIVVKSNTRATIISGNYFDSLKSAIEYVSSTKE